MTITKYLELSDRVDALERAVERLAVLMESHSQQIKTIVGLYDRNVQSVRDQNKGETK